MSVKLNYPFGSGGGGGADATKLPLAGGTMDVNATVLFPQTNGVDSEIGAWGFGVEKTTGTNAGSYSTVEPTVITQKKRFYNPDYEQYVTSETLITGNGISSQYVDDGDGDFWVISSGGVNGGKTDHFWNLNETGVSGGEDNAWSFGISGALFSDGSTQTTAVFPFTGGTITDDLILNNGTLSNEPNVQIGMSNGRSGWIRVSGSEDGDGNRADGYFRSEGVSGYPYPFGGNNTGHWQLNLNEVASYNGNDQLNWSVGNNGVTFPDETVQTTAGIPEAPNNGNYYVRKNGAWYQCTVYASGGKNYLTV